MDEVKLAKLFHQVYEDLAPSFGYETRTDTKEFDEDSKNGKLMIATCKAILPEIKASQLDALVMQIFGGQHSQILLTKIIDKLEEIRCGLIDIENGIEGIHKL